MIISHIKPYFTFDSYKFKSQKRPLLNTLIISTQKHNTYTLSHDRWLLFTRFLNTTMYKARVVRVEPAQNTTWHNTGRYMTSIPQQTNNEQPNIVLYAIRLMFNTIKKQTLCLW